jgi:hypothetical protein
VKKFHWTNPFLQRHAGWRGRGRSGATASGAATAATLAEGAPHWLVRLHPEWRGRRACGAGEHGAALLGFVNPPRPAPPPPFLTSPSPTSPSLIHGGGGGGSSPSSPSLILQQEEEVVSSRSPLRYSPPIPLL